MTVIELLYLNYGTYFGGRSDQSVDQDLDRQLRRDKAAFVHDLLDFCALFGALQNFKQRV